MIFKYVVEEMVASHGWILWGAFLAAVTFSFFIIGAVWFQVRKTEKKILEIIGKLDKIYKEMP